LRGREKEEKKRREKRERGKKEKREERKRKKGEERREKRKEKKCHVVWPSLIMIKYCKVLRLPIQSLLVRQGSRDLGTNPHASAEKDGKILPWGGPYSTVLIMII